MKQPKNGILLKAVHRCNDCHMRTEFELGRDKEVWHECNKGNVRFVLPSVRKILQQLLSTK